MVRVRQIDTYLRSLARAADQSEGVLFGDPETRVAGVLCAWKATTDAIRRAARLRCNLLFVHEALFDPPGESFWSPPTAPFEGFLSWKGNLARVKLLTRHGITVLRSHSTADAICVQAAVLRNLGLEPQTPPLPTGFPHLGFPLQIADVKRTSLARLARRAARAFGLTRVRVAGNPRLSVTRVGNGWGGLSLARHVDYLEALRQVGCQAVIAGESEEYACLYIRDAGMGLIELGHAASENVGIEELAAVLSNRFPSLRISFYPVKPPFAWV